MRVVICGGGVVGASIAYFLALRGIAATVVEGTGVGCAASGKSGGFLAADWCDGSPLAPLARRSFALHAELARELDVDTGYRRLDTFAGIGSVAGGARPGPVDWVSDEVAIQQRIGTPETTAQIEPYRFTSALMQAAGRAGARLVVGTVTGLATGSADGEGLAVEVDGERIEADAVVVAMGPWSILASAWLPLPGVYGLKGHSIVFRTGTDLPAEALFLETRTANGEAASPEIFPRPDGTTYVCGLSSERPLPVDPAAVTPDDGAIERLHAICAALSPVLARSPVVATGACFRPVTQDGLPLIGAVAGVPGAYVATGHSVWGMLNAPATGEAMAELILDGAATKVDLAPFDPARLAPFDGSRLQPGAD